MKKYDAEFYDAQAEGSLRSAAAVISHVLPLLPELKSVVDVGCGTGTWLKALMDNGVSSVIGVDGAYVNVNQLRIPPANFVPKDLTQPLNLNRRFDLCISMEVAEHLPPERAEGFVADLVNLAPVVLFSAAVPEQGGTNHINEQWPDYWRTLFEKHRYQVVDCIRPKIWWDRRVDYFYRQNSLIFADQEHYPRLAAAVPPPPLSIVHPLLLTGRPVPTRKMLLKTFIEVNKWSIQARINRLARLFGRKHPVFPMSWS